MTDRQKLNVWDVGILIAIIPVVIYLLTYAHEYSYFKGRGIPLEFISIDIGTIFLIAGTNAPLFFSILLYWNAISRFVSKRNDEDPLSLYNHRVLNLMGLFGVMIIVGRFQMDSIKYVLLAAIFVLSIYYILPLLTQRKVKGYKNKLIKQESRDRAFERETLQWNQLRAIGFNNTNFLANVFIMIVLMNLIGYQSSKDLSRDLMFVDEPDFRVVRVYNNKAIMSKVENDECMIKVREIAGSSELMSYRNE